VKPVLTASEYGRVDKGYEGDLTQAMDRAGYAVALAAGRRGTGYGNRVVVLAGPGNNGGDGYVAARYLKSRGAAVEVHALAEPKTTEAIDAMSKARSSNVPIRELAEPVDAHLVVDSLFGGGVRGGLPEQVRKWMATSVPVVAVDYPTGLDPDTGTVDDEAFRAVETVTFSTLKTGHVKGAGPEHCGEVTVADIGINGGEPSMYVAEEADAPRPSRARTTHKWSAGAVLVVGGSEGLLGASIFTARSALNYGAGTVYFASKDGAALQKTVPEIPVLDIKQAQDDLERFDVVIAGPGLAEDDADSAVPILERASNVVLDAGGLTQALLVAAKQNDGHVVVTPHAGEYARLTGLGAGTYSIRAYAREQEVTVLLKGNPTQITDGGLPVLVTTGGPELASIGTGDVLAGMIGALWARGLDPMTAAVSGAFWHGRAAGDLQSRGTVTADRLADHIASFAW
jgi:hydroxyethylthiazole kinase-like uncharacterized protein yjeF